MRFVPAPDTTASSLLRDPPDETAIAGFEEAGAIVVRGLIGREWLGSLRENYARMARSADQPFGVGKPYGEGDRTGQERKLINRSGMWEDNDAFRAFLFESPIARAAAAVMRSRTAQLYEDLLITEPAGGKPHNSWHQDAASWPMTGSMLSSVWLSLEAVTAETGAMRFVKGSHRGPSYQPSYIDPKDVGDDALRWTGGKFPDVNEDPSFTIVQTETNPGDAVIFHPAAIHCAYGSAKNRDRRSFTIRFMGDDVRWLPLNRTYHPWMQALPLKKGEKIVAERMPVVWTAALSNRVLSPSA